MDIHTHWIFDEFYTDAPAMRKKIDEHFHEPTARMMPFEQRGVWNYWYIPGLYTYLRARPKAVLGETHPPFMQHLRHFAAREFGLYIPTAPFLSMYINGCGQTIHNDAKNGRLAYVFSLTKWKERHFSGGETLIYKTGDKTYQNHFNPSAGDQFYESVEPHFNRLAIFDDRIPHAVNPIQGTMDPADARFVLHGHMEEVPGVAFTEGGLIDTDLTQAMAILREAVAEIFTSHGYHGFITWEAEVEPSGITGKAAIKHNQLMPISTPENDLAHCTDEAMDVVAQHIWPAAERPSRLVFAISSGNLREA